METSAARHLYVAAIVILLLIAIEIAVYFTVSAKVERDMTFSLMKGLGSAFKSAGHSMPQGVKKDACAALQNASTAPAPGNSRIRATAIGVALLAFLCAGVVTSFLWRTTALTAQDKARVMVEVGCVALGFLCFDLFFFCFIVRGNEPVTASGLLVAVGKETLNALSLPTLQREAGCRAH